jgi:hypothetical protein
MFAYIVVDPDKDDQAGANIFRDADERLILICHPSLRDKVMEGIELTQNMKLKWVMKDEWEKANFRFVSQSEGEKTPTDSGEEDI